MLLLRFSSEYKRLQGENALLKTDLSIARAQVSDLLSLTQRQAEEAATVQQKLIDRVIALSSPQTYTLLSSPPQPRLSRPRQPTSTRWPGWRPDTEPVKIATVNAEN